ncbi:MAG: hypothetical protein JNJ88_14030 [Planctomycetes bacterium]|nr:hypothetical protein [Planctomycetota bacterium]
MARTTHEASLSQSQGRAGWSIIFRHPLRHDRATGKLGLRVRRGLGTRDRGEAERLVGQLNEILEDKSFHSAAARADASHRFDSRVVEIFYDGVEPDGDDHAALRELLIPLPGEATGYRRVLLIGTTGAGKTTLVRQLIGTDPETERFPSTSTAKTTVHDTEIILDEDEWRAVVTFVSIDEVREYMNECISAAVLTAYRGARDAEILRRLLNHVNQRFRFSYVLGNGSTKAGNDFEDDECVGATSSAGPTDHYLRRAQVSINLDATNSLLDRAVQEIRALAKELGSNARAELDAQGGDERIIDEMFEEELDSRLRDNEVAHSLADELIDEIEKRFDVLPEGKVTRSRQGWPIAWHSRWPTHEREEFMQAIACFSSNYAPLFGYLMTPLVSGVRVAGPFSPKWAHGAQPRFVLLDGEGLGHVPNPSTALSTSLMRRINETDAIVLVDSAKQPMQAAPIAAMREIVSSGNARKLVVAFTHFDEVMGDNLPTATAKTEHVLASAENVLAAIGEELGPFAERALRQRIESARVFLGGINRPLSSNEKDGVRTIKQIEKLIASIEAVSEPTEPGHARPVYDRINLVLAVKAAAEAFHDSWFPLLGLQQKAGILKEHWTRIKALARRLATGVADEYDSLRPVASLRKDLLDKIFVFLQSPRQWEGGSPTDDEKQNMYNALAENISQRMLRLARRRVWEEKSGKWTTAYDQRGKGSSYIRAHIIGIDIYDPAAPIPNVTPSPGRNEFVMEVIREVEDAIREVGARLR